jgi:hypothetical protein
VEPGPLYIIRYSLDYSFEYIKLFSVIFILNKPANFLYDLAIIRVKPVMKVVFYICSLLAPSRPSVIILRLEKLVWFSGNFNIGALSCEL